jgi:hypothetical protein
MKILMLGAGVIARGPTNAEIARRCKWLRRP